MGSRHGGKKTTRPGVYSLGIGRYRLVKTRMHPKTGRKQKIEATVEAGTVGEASRKREELRFPDQVIAARADTLTLAEFSQEQLPKWLERGRLKPST